ncbi:hypothetical protein IGI04_040967 [Brassica rapa subsp. trilocularis]|uniref:Uncharacterized protein n=1 Tax=Brassica rapa subsp. trilocularis TaxID=1813537 RepID=A0ABQ7KTH1_BRACM|nr:hypothetical protein IGI04_040967 [Brassica rapa subsp. trilocularis]
MNKRREAVYHCKKNKEEDVIGQKVNSSWNQSKGVKTRKSDGEIGFEEMEFSKFWAFESLTLCIKEGLPAPV